MLAAWHQYATTCNQVKWVIEVPELQWLMLLTSCQNLKDGGLP